MTPREWVREAEKQWAPRLEQVGLACELDASDKVVRNAANSLGRLWSADRRAAINALYECPSTVVLAFTGAAIEEYDSGRFWPEFAKRLGVTLDSNEQSAWGQAFLAALRTLGLPTFPDFPRTILGPVLMHAGIPNSCLPEYFQALDMASRHVGADPQDVADWIADHAWTSLRGVNRPTTRFVEFGGEYSVDFVGRTLDVLADLSADRDPSARVIPERVVSGARDYLADQHTHYRPPATSGGGRASRPEVHLDPYGGELTLVLPPITAVDDYFEWRISLDGTETRIRPRQSLGGRSIGVHETIVQLPTPVRRASVSASNVDAEHDLIMFEDSDPLMIFNETGQLLSGHQSLPAAPVWALFRAPDGIDHPTFDDLIMREETAPFGWGGWRLALVDLEGQAFVQLTPSSPRHGVRVQSRARVDDGRVVAWMRADGQALMVDRPVLHLPDGLDARWSITVRNLVTNDVRLDTADSHSTFHDAIDPFKVLDAPVVGLFEIKVEGPLGRGTRRRVAIAEGLAWNPSDAWRGLSPRGLQAMEISLGGEGLICDPSSVHLNPTESAASVDVAAHGSHLSVEMRPPSMATALERGGRPEPWLEGHVTIANDDLTQTRLMVRTPPQDRSTPLLILSESDEVQRIRPADRGTRTYLDYPLAALTTTITDHPLVDLFVDVRGTRYRVARVEPPRIATGARVEGGRLCLEDFTGGQVAVHVWSVFEPWQQRFDAALDDTGCVALPANLQGRGRLAVEWERHDPWVPSTVEALPRRGAAIVVEAPLDPAQASAAALALAHEAPNPERLPVEHCWPQLAMRYHVSPKYLPWATTAALTKTLQDQPVHALLALAASPLSSRDRLKALVQSRLAWHHLDPTVIDQLDDARVRTALRQAPLAGAFLAAPVLARLDGPQNWPATWSTAEGLLGLPFTRILTGRHDPHVKEGGFRTAGIFASLDDDQRRAILAGLRVVPKSLLDGDSRIKAAIALFESRKSEGLRKAALEARGHVKHAQQICQDWHLSDGLDLLSMRDDAQGRGGWYALSAASAALALLARLAARGDGQAAAYLDGHFGTWVDLAHVAPDHVTLDLVLAEVMVAAHTAESLPRAPDEEEDSSDDSDA